MKILLKNGRILTKNGFIKKDVFVNGSKLTFSSGSGQFATCDCSDLLIIPGFVDVHVHLREPGFFYKETIKTGTMAAARGGYTAVCPMPNLDPVPADMPSLQKQLDIINRDAAVKVYPYGTITRDQNGRGVLSEMEAMKDKVIAFSDDGKGIQTASLMKEAMKQAKKLDKLIVAHCEDESLLDGGYIHDGVYAKTYGHKGICSESEWSQVKRDIDLSGETGAAYHICHISTKETVELVRQAKKEGLKVTCETTPHYLIFCDEDLQEDGKFKMNPPIRSREDRAALIEGIQDGTIDMIATDHAPHSREEKSKGLADSAFGIVGLETAFAVLNTALVSKGVISLEKLIHLMAIGPREVFTIEGGYIEEGQTADIAILDLNRKYAIDPAHFTSMGKATPFEGMQVQGTVTATYVNGRKAYDDQETI